MTTFPRRELHTLSGLSHPHSLKCFLVFTWTILCFSWCPLLLVFSLGTNEKNLAPSSFATSLQVFVHIDEILTEAFLLRAAQFLLSLSSYEKCCRPFISLVAFHWTCCSSSISFVLGSPGLDTVLQIFSEFMESLHWK